MNQTLAMELFWWLSPAGLKRSGSLTSHVFATAAGACADLPWKKKLTNKRKEIHKIKTNQLPWIPHIDVYKIRTFPHNVVLTFHKNLKKNLVSPWQKQAIYSPIKSLSRKSTASKLETKRALSNCIFTWQLCLWHQLHAICKQLISISLFTLFSKTVF